MQLELLVPGPSGKSVEVADAVFDTPFNESLVHQIVVAYQAGGRSGSKKQKSRSEVKGTGKKPWRQKGTGRARAGSFQSPIWRSGGVTFAARPQNHQQKVNRKMYKGALRSLISELVREGRISVLDEFKCDTHKTKDLHTKLSSLELDRVLIVDFEVDNNLYLASRNLVGVDVCDVIGVNPVSLLSFDKILITVPALKMLEERLQ